MFQGQPLIRFWDSFFHHYYILLLFIIFMWSLYIYIFMICVWYVYGSPGHDGRESPRLCRKWRLNDRWTILGGEQPGEPWGTQKKLLSFMPYAIHDHLNSFHIISVLSWLIFHGWHCWHLSCPPVIFTTILAAVVEQCGALRKENGESRERRCSGPATWCALQLWCALAGCWDDSEAWNGWKPICWTMLNHCVPPKCIYIYL